MSDQQSDFDRRARELADKPRAERFEQLIEFPTAYTIKIIGRGGDSFSEAVRATLETLGFGGVVPSERMSSTGRFTSLTVVVNVSSGVELDGVYSELEQLPGLAYLL